MIARRVGALALLCVLGCAAPAAAAVGPGRVTFPVNPTAEHVSGEALGLSVGVALPGGGVVLAGIDRSSRVVLAQLHADGSLDPAFGTGGIARLAAPTVPSFFQARHLEVLRERDGRLLVVAAGPGGPPAANVPMVVVGLTAGGAQDPSFGVGGFATPGVQWSCENCSPAAITPEGGVVLTGNTGQIPTGIAQHPGVVADFHWVVARLTPTGILDARFGEQGIAALPGRSGGGYTTASLPGGAVAVLGRDLGGPKLARLAPGGNLDPFFNHGAPVKLSRAFLLWFGLRGRADGSIDALGSGPDAARLVRYTATGNLDPDFGTSGVVSPVMSVPLVATPAQLLPAPRGGDVVVAPFAGGSSLERPVLRAARVTAGGTVAPAPDVPLVFGGGATTVVAVHDQPTRTSLRQTGFVPGRPLARADGSLVVPGAIGVVQYTGRDVAHEIDQAAVAAVTPAFALDRSFGGPRQPARIAVRVAPRVDGTAVSVTARTSGPGLCLLRVMAGERVIARSTVAVFSSGPQPLRALLTSAGRRYVRQARRVRVTLTATFRDLVAEQASASVAATLQYAST